MQEISYKSTSNLWYESFSFIINEVKEFTDKLWALSHVASPKTAIHRTFPIEKK
jgi:hypothetical protein